MTENAEKRRQLLQLYRAALRAVNGEKAVLGYLEQHPLHGEWAVVAIGKAAAAMAMGAQEYLGRHMHSGMVITKHGHGDLRLGQGEWQVIESGHPLPDESSLDAGESLLAYLDNLPAGTPLLFLLSGGASALVEALPQGITLSELERVNDWLLGSGLGIGQMNSVRKRLSRIKGGRLARHLHGRHSLQLLISDVPGDDPATIGSGPLCPSTDEPLPESLPLWLQELLQHGEAKPDRDDICFKNIETHLIASNDIARQTAAEIAREMELEVHDHPGHFEGQAEALAREFAQTLLQGEPGIYLWGGESSVRLPANSGKGGRNQHLALAAARQLNGHNNVLLLVAGTDGTDGPTEEAGALVDGTTFIRGEEEGHSANAALAGADSGSFLEASGDLIETGPTGTNVMDLVIGWKWREG